MQMAFISVVTRFEFLLLQWKCTFTLESGSLGILQRLRRFGKFEIDKMSQGNIVLVSAFF